MNILLVRHGQTDENALGILQGHQDTRLNAVGRAQAEALAARVATFEPRIAALVTSDLSRASDTARAISAALGIEPIIERAWRERAFGEFEGRTLGEAEVWRAAAGGSELPGAEGTAEFRARVKRALRAVLERFAASDTVAIVTHGGPMRAVLALLHDGELPLADGHPRPEVVPIENCSIMQLVVEPASDGQTRWQVRCVNDVDHLTTSRLSSRVEVVQE